MCDCAEMGVAGSEVRKWGNCGERGQKGKVIVPFDTSSSYNYICEFQGRSIYTTKISWPKVSKFGDRVYNNSILLKV